MAIHHPRPDEITRFCAASERTRGCKLDKPDHANRL